MIRRSDRVLVVRDRHTGELRPPTFGDLYDYCLTLLDELASKDRERRPQ